ncbi:outer membrane protein assembly factor BamE [Jannaschia rubra]|uniref:SmpA / OmlA family protein n=1 Tax=Jannaschia rubra TaxID=282197 RepID=A0A0M6XPF7_9RHOB|nr:outer membrane protein assembly factor BamE [Jannaschia rubra]CTQ33046.1 SmpA / OmlA family protein [Jannaschia rubra]SFG57907.1 Beta-barrel assembly machine subunit BamE [Jannaschia rubra]
MTTIFKGLLIGALLAGLAACSAIYRNHGYVPDEAALQSLSVGSTTRDQVATSIGRPSTNGVERDDAWYYVQSRVKTVGPFAPETEKRELVAVSFAGDRVANIERFGLERGRVVTLSRRVTATSIREFGLIQNLIRNFGRVNVGETLADGI